MNTQELLNKLDANIMAEQKLYPCYSQRASSLGGYIPSLGGCLLRGVFDRTKWEQKKLPDARLLRIYREGKRQEILVLRELEESGIPVIQQQIPVRWEAYNITGSLDGKIVFEGETLPLEIKSCAPHIYDQINTIEDFQKYPWFKKYIIQLQIYMFLSEDEEGIFCLKNKSAGDIKFVAMGLDYSLVELAVQASEAIEKHLKDKTEPERCLDRECCKMCDHSHHCLPEVDFGAPLKLIDDPLLEEKLIKYFELKELAYEWSTVEKAIKASAKQAHKVDNGCNMLIGNYRISTIEDGRGITTNIEKVV